VLKSSNIQKLVHVTAALPATAGKQGLVGWPNSSRMKLFRLDAHQPIVAA
jgi:hypothetical protein